ncbi:MAG: SAM-dependent methyltransferase [Bacteriovoracaceae bacterium]|nr:SAM-dependent methyltransferase [Bacteriovoracaceae bacterium]
MSELILIPTPIADELPLEPIAHGMLLEDALKENVVLLVEEHKVGRQRWIKWGLPREAIEKFQLYNEHTQDKFAPDVIKLLKAGHKVYLLSDCGLPAFCDPGQTLVDLCHKQGIKVTSAPFPNSIALAVALSGFPHSRFSFCGFVPVKDPDRDQWIKAELKRPETLVWMETPYRLKKLMNDILKTGTKREVFLGMDLGGSEEKLLRGPAAYLSKQLAESEKREFVLVIAPL